jgi:hypothetical protein
VIAEAHAKDFAFGPHHSALVLLMPYFEDAARLVVEVEYPARQDLGYAFEGTAEGLSAGRGTRRSWAPFAFGLLDLAFADLTKGFSTYGTGV